MLLVGLTGFVLEVAVYVSALDGIGYWFFLVHVVLAMELLVLFPFSKFAHDLFRPLALGLYSMRSQ
jgi:nitrate reductase gamma subunit